MQSIRKLMPKVSHLFGGVAAGILLLVVVACGTEATATPVPTTAEPVTAQPVTAQPVPAATAVSAADIEAEINPGKVTWLTPTFGTERMHAIFASPLKASPYAPLVHDWLIKSDVNENGDYGIAPGIATDWSVSGDGRTWTFTIREGVTFHDGTVLTPEDVLWSWQFCFGPDVETYGAGSDCATAYASVESFAMGEGRKISLTTKTPDGSFPGFWLSEGGPTWPGIVYPAYLNHVPRANLRDEAVEAAYDKNPVGAGMFKMVKHVRGTSMTFERFDDYFYQPANGLARDRRPNFAQFELVLVPEEATRVAALRAGEADIAPISLPAREQVEAGGGSVVFGREGSMMEARMLGSWDTRFPQSDKRVRHALAYAVDLEVLKDHLWGPEVSVLKGWVNVTPSSLGYAPDLDPYPFDPDKARALMKEAGYRVPGSPEGKDFGTLAIDTWLSASVPSMPEAAQLVAEFWTKELGIKTTVTVGDQPAVKKRAKLTEELHGHILIREQGSTLDPSGHFLTSVFGHRTKNDRIGNDPALWAITDEAKAVVDPVKREKALHDAYVILRDSGHYMGFGYLNIPFGTSSRIAEWKPYPFSLLPTGLDSIVLK